MMHVSSSLFFLVSRLATEQGLTAMWTAISQQVCY